MSGPERPASPCGDRTGMLRLAALHATDQIEPSGERLLRKHIAACPACFAEAVAIDPSLLFVRLSTSAGAGERASRAPRDHRQEPPEEELLAADVLAAIRVRATAEGGRPAYLRKLSRHWLRAAAVVLLAAGLAAVLVLRNPEQPASDQPEESLVVAQGTPSRPLIEEVASPGARVYEFAASTPQEPTVVFVANPDADL